MDKTHREYNFNLEKVNIFFFKRAYPVFINQRIYGSGKKFNFLSQIEQGQKYLYCFFSRENNSLLKQNFYVPE